MQCTYRDIVSTARNSFWTGQFWCLLVLLPFCFTSPTSAKCFLLGLLSSKETNEMRHSSWIGWIGRVGPRGHAGFGQNCWTLSVVWAGVLLNHPPWNGQMHWKRLQKKKKNSLKPNTASHNNASRYTETNGLLEHSPSGGSLYYKGSALQKIIPGFFGSPHRTFALITERHCIVLERGWDLLSISDSNHIKQRL